VFNSFLLLKFIVTSNVSKTMLSNYQNSLMSLLQTRDRENAKSLLCLLALRISNNVDVDVVESPRVDLPHPR
jgi:hypothetical protein